MMNAATRSARTPSAPQLLAHRDFIYREHLELPVEL
jgi:hypothetical protein